MSTILITGASTGIGRATAKHFAENGWNVIATMRAAEAETELSQWKTVLVARIDVEQKETINEAVNQGIDRFGSIDVLLNNAGYGSSGIFEAASDEQIRRQFEVNVFGLMNMTRAVLPHFRSNRNGLILNVSSVGGIVTMPTMSLYHATKFAVEGFTESLSYELASQNIRVKLIEPGSVRTDFGGRSMDFFFDDSLPDYKEFADAYRAVRKQMGENAARQSSPESVAETIYQAATDPSNRLRYAAGADAEALIRLKQESGDLAAMQQIASLFSLHVAE
ncbi:short-chain dehydrogenase/reductase [Paenibacillus ferrarius]|uniref:Short-chain dehydrogenase/reductase n=1 Tax=Paenibacillus ferrarius TaxID=1469647 RepID=A0A1V4HLU4_9BACL|nr:SDR family oxidoreductase [Paenibacillus ferrarius]OPH58366.1 short-chain dehydrogenase/reductase [Paenibacillus ferrarius]